MCSGVHKPVNEPKPNYMFKCDNMQEAGTNPLYIHTVIRLGVNRCFTFHDTFKESSVSLKVSCLLNFFPKCYFNNLHACNYTFSNLTITTNFTDIHYMHIHTYVRDPDHNCIRFIEHVKNNTAQKFSKQLRPSLTHIRNALLLYTDILPSKYGLPFFLITSPETYRDIQAQYNMS